MQDNAPSGDRTRQAPRAEYVNRVNRVMGHIEQNLDQALSLAALADIANFSRFHFHRIFGAMVDETLHQFIQRLRTERAATLLTAHPGASVTQIALDCAFSSSTAFARSFKEAFGVSATDWRAGGHRKICEVRGKNWKAFRKQGNDGQISPCYIDSQTGHPT